MIQQTWLFLLPHQPIESGEHQEPYSVENIPIAAIAIIAAVPHPKPRNSRELTRLPMTFGLLVSNVTRMIKGGAKTPLRTAE